ncbi:MULTISPECIES: anti-sigma factor domain-containing protein [unclassified Cryobacterium]|uniref:anti-sigma factor domain-containing protein n=1 Tax=unclassified Cryobacterium TaxID=2649013 RepID=UPI00106AF229|nr:MULTISPECIES: anti-sigma factor [unclassified Cryobacterium]TFB96030.1 anti-sigma factor [Cryobacterium sp. MDB2-A-1]TFC07932.1 anti-sigma factor [Cryobacterium sp. MDB2-33-2]TFC13190.1 anti-sigma factor [Cryobacterium sp. MDB2-A-2]TFC16325.1 anti-sigma factor [Cryobacterium sp. MDB2-10]TFC28332.1 anti-sigma factor [Cryobacterium sp. MDB1-18-2]
MTHIDRDDLALIALAEFDLTEAERVHLSVCPQCALELISLQHTASVGRSARHISLTEPAGSVWAGIHSTLSLSGAVGAQPRLRDFVRPADAEAAGVVYDVYDASDNSEGCDVSERYDVSDGYDGYKVSDASAASDASEVSDLFPGSREASAGDPAIKVPARPVAALPVPVAELPVSPSPPPAAQPATPRASDSPARLRPRRRVRSTTRTWVRVLIAAAASLALLLAGFGAARWADALRPPATAPITFEAQLTPFPGWKASGSAAVEVTPGGHREVVVDLTGLAVATAAAPLREVWLIKADASGLISIGLLDGNIGHFDIPDGVDLAQYPLVDVSAEPDNGNPAHSGNSIVRGELHAM